MNLEYRYFVCAETPSFANRKLLVVLEVPDKQVLAAACVPSK